jgi:hypothetical protein
VADTVLQILERARIGNWTMGQLAEECIKEGMEMAAEIVADHWNNQLIMVNQKAQAERSAQAIRSAKEKL